MAFGDTPDFSAPSLCRTCRHGQVIEGHGFHHLRTVCRVDGSDGLEIKWPVSKCTEYDDKRQPSIWQMEKIAYRFSVDNRKKTVGFLSPREWKELNKDRDD